MLFTYQKRISFGLCILFIYYYAFPLFESYELGESRFNHAATFHLNYLPLYVVSLYQNSQEIIAINLINYDNYSLIIIFIISLFLLCELLFYLRWRYLEHYINSNLTIFHTSPSITNKRRDHILKMAAKYAALHENGMRGWLSLWFKGYEFDKLCYDNVVQYLDWAFFLKTATEATYRQKFKQFAMTSIQNMTNHTFRHGYNPQTLFVHNTNDNAPISTTYRPFIFYLCLFIAQFVTDLIFIYVLHFKYKYINGLKVWYKIQSNYAPNQNKSKPILLIHGLGVHYMPYIPLIYKIITKSIQHDVCCIEIPWTAMSLLHFIPQSIWNLFSNKPSPSYIDSKLPATRQDFVQILMHMEHMILGGNVQNALQLEWSLIGHSYGSFIVSGIYSYIKEHRQYVGTNMNLPRLILLDPVTLCLSQPTTVSFLCLPARDWASYFMQQLAARELMIACTLSKYFHWFEFCLFPEDLINDMVEHVVFTGTMDKLVPHKVIKKGIDAVNDKRKEEGYRKIHHIEFENMHHAVWMGSMSCVQRIVDVV